MKLQVEISDDLRKRVNHFKVDQNCSVSEAVTILLERGLGNVTEPLSFHAAAAPPTHAMVAMDDDDEAWQRQLDEARAAEARLAAGYKSLDQDFIDQLAKECEEDATPGGAE